ncbi:hypothetical protein BDV25DRAFT_150365 [Aspergillus avenaceus]|uniref:Cullin binding protein CanA n=1 Tax=Aspergillus avenaceus TaxID=36643 RepID=A0A5N6U3R8_ASPAV|nr:hypothetical protein BDV25DRAFT_150365 [Aspergillus avenaceus]
MPFSDHTPRLDYLKNAASSLESLSPSTAAHLMMTHNHIYLDEYKALNQRQQEACCAACGSNRNPEWTKMIQRKKKNTKGKFPNGATIYKCLRCKRRTVKPSRTESVRPITTSDVSTTDASTLQSEPAVGNNLPNKTADNSNSKKRAKARKQGGLQALLASKQQSQSKSSLDLFDFLQQ